MRYDQELNRLVVSVKEFVTTSRRGISSTHTPSEDVPELPAPDDRPTDRPSRELRLVRECGGYTFELYGTPDGLSDDTVTVIRRISSRGGRVKKEEKEEARGEGFILAYMLLCASGVCPRLRTVYCDGNGETVLDTTEPTDKERLAEFFAKCLAAVAIYARPEIERVTLRVPSFKNMKFPYESPREGQREFIRAVYRSIARGTRLYACAPTGTGKTVSVLYPALKALGDGRCEKVFYLTPKHTTAEAARDCLDLFAERGALPRAIILSSKERSCTEGMLCKSRRGGCSLTLWQRLPDAVLALYDLGRAVVDIRDVRRIALLHSVCPHELSLCYAEICDVIICDFNYLFDPSVYLRRFFDEGGDYALLVDEAHNLPDRAREMYSAELSLDRLTSLADSPLVGEHSPLRELLQRTRDGLYRLLYPYIREELREGVGGDMIGATHLSDLPGDIYPMLDALVAGAENALYSSYRDGDEDAEARTELLKVFYYDIKKLCMAAQLFDERYRLFLFYEGGNIRFQLYCLDTGGVIASRLERGRGAVFFSATLTPLAYYKALLGGDGASDTLVVRSPFDPSQLSVSIVDKISTRYSERERTLPAVCRTVAAVMSARRGHYMVFSPSFEYGEALASAFQAQYPKIRVLCQRRDMTATEKSEFLAEFDKKSDGYLVGFCVMGGIYSEGVDLAGDSLIGAVVVGIGMPTLSYEREVMREYFEERYEAGTQYAYLYPGMNRVFQAAGRVIRREEDRGVIVLIDDRFRDPIYKKSIPSLWKGMKYIGDAKELKAELLEFWKGVDETEGVKKK